MRPTRSPRARKSFTPSAACFRSALTNGSAVLVGVDARSAWARRFRDVIAGHESDLGGRELLSEGQKAIVRRVALLQCWLEVEESKIAAADGAASEKLIDTYQRTSGALRRLLESLGLNEGRKARDLDLDPLEYARRHSEAAE
jgi:hypothetical protein